MSSTRAVILVLLLAGLASDGPSAQGRVPRIAAASSVNVALSAIAERYREQRGERVDVVFGASGVLARQIEEGAPFDMFLAADEEFPARLAAAGLTTDGGVVYALGRLVLFAPSGSPLSVDAGLEGLARLQGAGQVKRFAIANPAVAPYGRAAEAVLRGRGLWDAMRPSLVLGNTVAQAAQFAAGGNTAGGLVAYSVVRGSALERRGQWVLVPAAAHAPIRHRMVFLRRAVPGAEAFYRYIQGTDGRAILAQHGFDVP